MASPSPTPSSSSSSKCSFVSYSDGDALTESIVPTPPHIFNADKPTGSLASLTDRCPDEMSFDELKQCFEATKIRLKETETNLDKYKLTVQKNQNQSRSLASDLKEHLGLTSGMFQSAAPNLQTTCNTLRQQRDRLVDEICLLSQSHKAKGATCNADQLKTAFTIQHQSIQQEIQAARDLLEQLDQRRDAILEEMVLLNTKNAELNTMNNDLSRHIAQRELETKTLMAATQFIHPSSSSETTASSSTYPPPTRPLPNPSTSSSTNSSTSTTYSKPTKKQQKQAKKKQQDQEDQDQPTSASSETRIFPFSRHKNVFATGPDLGSRLAKMNQVFRTIPKENFHTIHHLMRHLDRVQQHSATNLMVTKNLALVFGPTLIRKRDEKDDITETSQKIHVIDFILHHINELFETSPPTSP
ncbi:hypothetical protein [Absidia glauca]|uniref:Rho-GAP domain-containing protein n=1 Tax=Absidia glauca TaxID=4829 RepID=A0A163IWB9_ABSGL|nr:hypothetical protein [Absidia glauca]